MESVTRLYTQFIPTNYKIHWNLSTVKLDRQISGSVTIIGSQLDDNSIRLHSHELNIVGVKVNGEQASDYELKPELDELVISHSGRGEVSIVIDFNLTLTDQMHGLYPCYFDINGERQEMYASQFESHHAREAFPCIDEPEAKATYDISITHSAQLVALSNMPIISADIQSDNLLTVFKTTPIMSSYLVAFVVGDIHSKTTRTKRGVEVNVWASKAQPAESLDFALQASADMIDFYEEYFGIEYPLDKCDHVALPDFSSGAMENWGLITYREVCLLAHPKTTGVAGKHLIASVVAHELAHQWFGNLVTMQWWNNLWLNESFADFVEHIAIDELYPEWETWLDFVLSRGIGALRRDAIDGVQSVQVEVNHPDEISTLFDPAIVYGKGARLMKMLRSYVGDEAFRHGLKAYFTKFAYKNTTGDDLWQALSDASGKSVGAFMNPWIQQAGYPLLDVTSNQLSQTQFFIGEHQPSDKLWPILLSANPANDLPEILDTASLEITIANNQRLNSGDVGHFITKYQPEHLNALLQNIQDSPTIDRLTLLNDQTLLVRGRYQSSATLIDLIKYYKNETNDSVWGIIAMTLGELKPFVEGHADAEDKLRHLSKTTAQQIFDKLGFDVIDGESVNDTKLRGTAVSMMIYGNDQSVIDSALERFDINNLDDLPEETRSLVIGVAVRHHQDASVIPSLIKLYGTTPSAEIKDDIMSALCSTKDAELGKQLLNYCKDPTVVRPQDVAHWFVYLVRNRYVRETAWSWLQNNWDWIIETFGGDKSFDEFPRYAAGGLVNDQQFAEYQAFFTPMLKNPALTRTIKMGFSEISARIDLLKSDGDDVRSALKNL